MSQFPQPQDQPQNQDSSQQYHQYGSAGNQTPQAQPNGFDQTTAYPSAQPQAPGEHPTGGYNTGGYSTGGYPSNPQMAADQYAGNGKQVGFFKALFDLKFEHFVTIKFASVIYIISIVVALLAWIGNTITLFLIGSATSAASSAYYFEDPSPSGGMILGMLSLFLGWIPAVIQILITRVVLEFVVSSIRTAQNTTTLVHKN